MARPTKRGLSGEPLDDPFNMTPEQPVEGLLTAEDLARVEKEAQAEVDQQIKARALKRAKEQAVIRAKVAAGLLPRTADEPEVTVRIDVAKFAPNVILDQRIYWHGYSYKVPSGVARTLLEIMHRTHGHEAEVQGRSRFESAQRQRPIVLGPRGVTTSRNLRV